MPTLTRQAACEQSRSWCRNKWGVTAFGRPGRRTTAERVRQIMVDVWPDKGTMIEQKHLTTPEAFRSWMTQRVKADDRYGSIVGFFAILAAKYVLWLLLKWAVENWWDKRTGPYRIQ